MTAGMAEILCDAILQHPLDHEMLGSLGGRSVDRGDRARKGRVKQGRAEGYGVSVYM
jgi:hypothetical protein